MISNVIGSMVMVLTVNGQLIGIVTVISSWLQLVIMASDHVQLVNTAGQSAQMGGNVPKQLMKNCTQNAYWAEPLIGPMNQTVHLVGIVSRHSMWTKQVRKC